MGVSNQFAGALGSAIVLGLVGCSAADSAEKDPSASSSDALAVGTFCEGTRCDSVAKGAHAFLDRSVAGIDGNGRSCGDCHMPTDSFQLSPASADARWRDLQKKRAHDKNADDPLFRAIDADDFRTNGAAASDFSNLRQNGLVRITFNLPPNVKLVDPVTGGPSSETFVDVWRSVPSVMNVALTGPDHSPPVWARGPNQQGGYQLDARFGTLQEQAQGAFFAHAEAQAPTDANVLDDIAAFESALFSSARVHDLSKAIDEGAPLPDADGPLTDLEAQGKAVFQRACATCHGGPGMSTPQLHNRPGPQIPRYHDIGAACPRPVDPAPVKRWSFKPCDPSHARNARTYILTTSADITTPTGQFIPKGSQIRRASSDPGRILLTGFSGGPLPLDDWGKLDVTGLRGVSKTAPYFHNNSAATLEDVLDHYEQFFKWVQFALSPPGIIPPILTTDGQHIDRPFTSAERPALLAYLNTL